MKIAPVGRIGAYHHHTSTRSIVSIQREGSDCFGDNVAMMFCVNPSSEQEANMEKIVRAYNAYDQLVKALRDIKGTSPFHIIAAAKIAQKALAAVGEE